MDQNKSCRELSPPTVGESAPCTGKDVDDNFGQRSEDWEQYSNSPRGAWDLDADWGRRAVNDTDLIQTHDLINSNNKRVIIKPSI